MHKYGWGDLHKQSDCLIMVKDSYKYMVKTWTFPESMMKRTPSMVTEVSAIFVDTMHFLTPSGGKSNTCQHRIRQVTVHKDSAKQVNWKKYKCTQVKISVTVFWNWVHHAVNSNPLVPNLIACNNYRVHVYVLFMRGNRNRCLIHLCNLPCPVHPQTKSHAVEVWSTSWYSVHISELPLRLPLFQTAHSGISIDLLAQKQGTVNRTKACYYFRQPTQEYQQISSLRSRVL